MWKEYEPGERRIRTMKKFNKRKVAWLLYMLYMITWVLALGFANSIADAQTWNWSPPAPHHTAACVVQSGDRGGSGIYIKYGDLRGVLTAAHITKGQDTQVTFSDGTKATGKSTIDKFGHDVAFIFVDNSAITPVAIANIDPQPGDRVEFLTTGGPEHRLRMFWATIRTIGESVTEYNCDVLAGDSGGAILNTQFQLVGIQYAGRFPLTTWPAYRGAISVSCKPIRDFLGRVAKCGPKGCPLPGGGVQFYPPKNPKLVPIQKPTRPVAQPLPPETPGKGLLAPPLGLSIDYDKLIKMILAKIDLEDFRGPVGPVGPAGETGLRGGPGLKGRNGPMGPPGATEIIDIDDLIKQINKRISGSIRVKVRPIQSR